MTCPQCQGTDTAKVIAAGLPMKLCFECSSLWGEPWAFLYTFFVAPIEGLFNDEYTFFAYRGSYIEGLWMWFHYRDEDE